MSYISLPIKKKIENKIVFYLNIEEPYRGTSKLRGIQIFNELKKNNVDVIWIPSLHGHQLNKNLDINIFEYIYNCKIIFIKYPVIDFEIGIKILNMLKKNNNTIIYDFIDTNINKCYFSNTINYYDTIIFMDIITLNRIIKKFPVIKNKSVIIEHHYDIEIDKFILNNSKIQNPKIYYFGNIDKTLLGNYFDSLNIINKSCWNQKYLDTSIAHICLRSNRETISQLKVGNCVAIGSVPIINSGIYDELFDNKYPYILREISINELKKILDKVKKDYFQQNNDWKLAQNYVKKIKIQLSISNLIKKYLLL